MKKYIFMIIATIFISLSASVLFAMEDTHKSHHKHDSSMDHSKHMGILIREVKIKGYELTYHLIDIRKKMVEMEDMKNITITHHLMVYIKDSHGNQIKNAKVGYLIQNPNGEKQKSMTMAMGGGFGSDIKMQKKGVYSIITKILISRKKVIDKFNHNFQ